jgi:SAM-dependent methyltransferase
MASVYDSERLAAAYARDRPPIHERILRAARLTRQADLALDIGCGAGLSTTALAPLAKRAIGLEPVSTMLTHRRTVARDASFVIGRAECLPFAAESFDLVAAAGSMNYTDLPAALAEIGRVLTRDGTFLLYDFSTGRRSVSGDELADWFDSFERRFPWPPGWMPLDVRELAPGGHGLRLIDYTDLEVRLPMDLGAYLRYMLSEVNVDDAIARGACGAEEARDWCIETLKPVFADRELTVVIPGYIATLARLPSHHRGGRGACLVESGDRVGIQGQLGSRQDLVELSDRAGAGDRDDRRLRPREQPGEHDLTRCGAKFAGHLPEHGEPLQAARVGVGGG